jgi:predicted TIM-barrel fold metal-dependent hydrolase
MDRRTVTFEVNLLTGETIVHYHDGEMVSAYPEEATTMDAHDFTVKFDGKGYRFEVYVNTNEDPGEIAKRLQKAARGQLKAACVVTAAELTVDEVKDFMAKLAKLAATGAGTEYKI